MTIIVVFLLLAIYALNITYTLNKKELEFKKQLNELWDQINFLSDHNLYLMEQLKEMREEHYDISRQQIKTKEIHPSDNTGLH